MDTSMKDCSTAARQLASKCEQVGNHRAHDDLTAFADECDKTAPHAKAGVATTGLNLAGLLTKLPALLTLLTQLFNESNPTMATSETPAPSPKSHK